MNPRAAEHWPHVLTGIALTGTGYALFSLQDAIAKWLVQAYTVPELLFTRSLVIVGLILCVRCRETLKGLLLSQNKRALVLRAALILAAWALYFSAARHLGLAQLTTLYFAAPPIAVALAIVILRERVGVWRWLSVALGFAGVVVAAGPPGALPIGPALQVLAAAACWAGSVILVRWINRSDTTATQMLASNLLFVLACAAILPWVWKSPDRFGLGLMVVLGLIGGLGQWVVYEGFRFAPASVVAPVEYTGLVWAFVYGYAIWTDIPALHVFAGAVLIVASSLILIWFERRRATLEARPRTTAG